MEKETEPAPVPISEAMTTKSITGPLAIVLEDVTVEPVGDPLAPVSEAMIVDQGLEPATLVLGAKAFSEKIKPITPVSESFFFFGRHLGGYLGPNSRFHPL